MNLLWESHRLLATACILIASLCGIDWAAAQPKQDYRYVNATGLFIVVNFYGDYSFSATWHGPNGGVQERWNCNASGDVVNFTCSADGNPGLTQYLRVSENRLTIQQGTYRYDLQP